MELKLKTENFPAALTEMLVEILAKQRVLFKLCAEKLADSEEEIDELLNTVTTEYENEKQAVVHDLFEKYGDVNLD